MDEIKNPEEPNNPEKRSAWPFSEEWTEAWKQLKERVRQGPRQHILMALGIGYLLQIIFLSKTSRTDPKALPDIGATGTLSGLRFSAGKIRE
jgi:hypothetical protein